MRRDRDIAREDLPKLVAKVEKVATELIGIPHVVIATSVIRGEETAWLHISADADTDELKNMLREFFRHSLSVFEVAKQAIKDAEDAGNNNNADINKEALRRHISKWVADKLGMNVEPKDIKDLGNINTVTGEGLDELIDALNKAVEDKKNASSNDIDELLRSVFSKKDDEEGNKQG